MSGIEKSIMNKDKRLSHTFYTRTNVVQIAKDLLGKVLCTNFDGLRTEAIISETEAYAGITDKASHAFGGRRSNRTEIMYWQGGCAYIYLCYGMYSLFNVVTNVEDVPHAVLIRGAAPLSGMEFMLQRSGKKKLTPDFLVGPGKLSKALGIHYSQTGMSLSENTIWIEDRGIVIPPKSIVATPRIGVDYAEEDAALPSRMPSSA
jgi:DNA-3-methyladenine glycosylase (3mg)